MDTINNKYYVGYEGYPEIEFVRVSSNGGKDILSMWGGYFDSIMYVIEPIDNRWAGIAYSFHVDMPWEERPWKIPNINNVIQQFKQIDISKLDDDVKEVLASIIDLLIKAQSFNEEVCIAYD